MKLALAGSGGINKVHARAALACGASLEAIVNHRSESMARFAREFTIPRQYTDLDDLLKDGAIDALVVSTPNYLHAPQTVAALEAGVPVIVEKPMAMNAEEAQQMCAAAEANDLPLMVAHCFRFDPDVLWLKEHLPQIGPIIRTKGYGVHVRWGPSGWFTEKEFAGGGAMADVGIHALDTVRFLLGDPQPVSVYAKIGTYYKKFDVDDTGLILVEWDNGTTSYIESGWWQPQADGKFAETKLYGMQGFGQLFPTHLELFNLDDPQRIERVESGLPFPRAGNASLYDAQMRHFLACVANHQTPNPGGREGLTNMQVVDAAYESARTGKVVELN